MAGFETSDLWQLLVKGWVRREMAACRKPDNVGRIPVSLTCQAGDPVDSPVTWASAPADAAAVARDVSDRADGVSGLVDPALPAHAPTGAVAAGDRRSVKRGCARQRLHVFWREVAAG